ncbi:hypothetical protein AC578_1729 [Pseudocercospora eumusae]|uniref:Uncharacterized protein n=1 Tax=Pseudocercospora eumusae TaxID=321146 RepID=A0A139GZX4_9PEZI|nr:hypothetical protein AC578_1729 [Pseudocercospora eumusae]
MKLFVMLLRLPGRDSGIFGVCSMIAWPELVDESAGAEPPLAVEARSLAAVIRNGTSFGLVVSGGQDVLPLAPHFLSDPVRDYASSRWPLVLIPACKISGVPGKCLRCALFIVDPSPDVRSTTHSAGFSAPQHVLTAAVIWLARSHST